MTRTEVIFTLAVVLSAMVGYYTGRAAQRADDRVEQARKLRRLEGLSRARDRGDIT